MGKPDANQEHVIEYQVRQVTTANDKYDRDGGKTGVERAIDRFEFEIKLQFGDAVVIERIDIDGETYREAD